MITFLILAAMAAWIPCVSALYGVIVGKTVQQIRYEAACFACASGFAASVLVPFLMRLAA